MNEWNRPFVIDREAYEERLAIMLESGVPANQASGFASDCAYRTPFSIAATAAIRGDWEPAKALCRAAREKHGEALARDLMREIQDAIHEHNKLW